MRFNHSPDIRPPMNPWRAFWTSAVASLLLSWPAAREIRAQGLPREAPPLPVAGLSGISFITADFGPIQRYYGRGAGFAEFPMDPATIRFLVGSSQWIEFRKGMPSDGARRLRYVTLAAGDLDGLKRELGLRGVPTTWVYSGPRDRELQFADPAGDLIRAARPWVPPPGMASPPSGFSRHLQHIGMAVPRALAEPAMAFYRDALGFPEVVRMNGPDGRLVMVKFRIPGPGRDLIELIFYDPPLNKWAAGAFDHLSLEVVNIDDAYRALHRGGLATQGNHLPTVNGEHLWAIDIIGPELTRMEIQDLKPTSTALGTVSNVGGESARPLFDGKTLAGWEGNLDNWRVEEGAIVAGALDRRQPHNEFLATARDYGNFELRLKYRIEGSDGFVNGGIQFWSQRVPGNWEVSGYQADLGAGTDGNLYDESRRGINLVMASPEVRAKALRPGGWNDYRIRAENAHIQIWLNGVKTADYVEPDKAVPRHGKFALQIHGYAKTKVWYKDLELEELPDSGN
jgi:catechol 2,3-dioxygenase-like lactoylglutathione lyase family enzyme